MMSRYIIVLMILLCGSDILMHDRIPINKSPRIKSEYGHLKFITVRRKNIYFKTLENGDIYFNDITMKQYSNQVKELNNTVRLLEFKVKPQCNCKLMEHKIKLNTDQISELKTSLNTVNDKIKILENKVNQVNAIVKKDNCGPNTCHNGGKCINGFNTYTCLCPDNYQGQNCELDVDECQQNAGTDLACQNNAVCENTQGSYRCKCTGKWTGVHCSVPKNRCSGSSNAELCGHGICIPDTSSASSISHRCICDNGWKLDPVTNTCTIDVDECSATNNQYPCSTHPHVQCVNTPGGFHCGNCPRGFIGNGFKCVDKNECTDNPNACPVGERCRNKFGSYKCLCARGMRRNNRGICQIRNICNQNNGGCNMKARCIRDDTNVNGRQCVCQSGYSGSGIGSIGCRRNARRSAYNRCVRRNFCGSHGKCLRTRYYFRCRCAPNYTGRRCRRYRPTLANPCNATVNPCLHGGICKYQSPNSYRCVCPQSYTGQNCQNRRSSCGGNIFHPRQNTILELFRNVNGQNSGINYAYPCTWYITTDQNKYIEIIPTSLNLYGSCSREYLNITESSSYQSNGNEVPLAYFCQGKYNKTVNSSEPTVVIRAGLINSYNQMHGFRIKIRTHNFITDENNCCACKRYSKSVTHNMRGILQSPSYPFSYPIGLKCSMFFDRGENYRSRVELRFDTLDLGLKARRNCFSSDRLIVVMGNKLIKITACNQNRYRNRRFIVPNFRISFKSDYKKGGNERFRITWRKARFTEKCGGILDAHLIGQITIPAMTKDDNVYCTWKVNSTNLSGFASVNFTLNPFTRTSLCQPKIILFTNNQRISKLYCPSRQPVELDIPLNKDLLIVYSKQPGFAVPALTISHNFRCGGLFNLDLVNERSIYSPNYPNNYPNNEFCIYKLFSKSRIITWQFKQLDIPDGALCSNDYIRMKYLKPDVRGRSRFVDTKLCNDNFNPEMKYSHQKGLMPVTIKFISNSSVTGFGFKLITKSHKCGFSIPLIDQANYTLSFPESYISNNMPRYSSNHRCNWTIIAPRNHFIRLEFSRFQLERSRSCKFDYLIIDELYVNSNNTYNRKSKKYCSTIISKIKIYKTNLIELFFKSDVSVSGEGFVVNIGKIHENEVCHFEYTKSSAAIVAKPDCQYIIRAPYKQRIRMNIDINDRQLPNQDIAIRCTCPYNEDKLVFSSNHQPVCRSCPFRKNFISTYNTVSFKYVTSVGQANPTKFNITYQFVITSDCGGILYQSSGIIESQNYPLYVPKIGYTCTWQIRQPIGHQTHFNITNFINRYRNCKYSNPTLQVYSKSKEYLIYCENDYKNMTDLVFDDSVIWVKFQPSNTKTLFSLNYRRSCSGIVLTKMTGRIASTQEFDQCSWKLMGLRGNKVKIEIDQFDLPMTVYGRCKTYLKISGSRGVILDKVCGNTLVNRTFESSDIPIKVEYVIADEHRYMIMQHKGIVFEYRVEGCVFNYQYIPHLYGYSQRKIESPNYPASVTDTDCVWTFSAIPSYSIMIQISKLHNYDDGQSHTCNESISVLTGYEEDDPVMNLCNGIADKSDAITFQSSTHKLVLRFRAGTKGRSFQGKFIMKKGSCERELNADSGIIKSPNYPKRYNRNQRCSWNIKVPQHHTIHLKFLDMKMESSCYHDHVKMYSTLTDSPILIDKVCKMSQVRNKTFSSFNNQMLVKFKSDNSVQKKGFKAEFHKSCGSLIHVNKDDLTSLKTPNYPNKYMLKDGFCEWRLVANMSDPSDRIFFYFNGFEHLTPQITRQNYECAMNVTSDASIPDNSLTIIDGMTDSPNGVKRICNSHGFKIPIISSGPVMRLKLKSTTGSLIFSASVSSGDLGCGGTMYHSRGVLTSPFYPNYEIRKFDCIWLIKGAPGSKIVLDPIDFSRKGRSYLLFDYLEIREGGTKFINSKRLGRFYHKDIITNFVNQKKFSNILWIRCHSQGSERSNLFRFMIKYNFVYPSMLTGKTGDLGSPLFGHLYPYDTNQIWYIVDANNSTTSENNEKTRIAFVFFSVGKIFQSYSRTSCRYGYLEISDADNQVDRLCGNKLPDQKLYRRPIKIELNAQNNRYPGFHLNWDENGNSTHVKLGKCEYIILASPKYQILKSPGFPRQDPNNRRCKWTIISPNLDGYLDIKMLNFSMEKHPKCKFETLDITWHEIKNYQYHMEKQTFCGNNISQFDMFSKIQFNQIKLEYSVDKYDIYQGFKLKFREKCYNDFFNKREGIIKSPPDLGAPYDCEYIIPYYSQNYTFKILTLDLPPKSSDNNCGPNSLWVSFSSRNYTLCGNTIPNELKSRIISHYDYPVIIKYKGNLPPNTKYKGYKIHFYAERKTDCSFDRTLTDSSETVLLEQPKNNKNVLCRWKIQSRIGSRLRIDVKNTFFSKCNEDSNLALYDGLTVLSHMITGSYMCYASKSLFTTSNSLLVVYLNHNSKINFKLLIKISSCGGERKVRRQDSIITSAQTGKDSNELCTWVIKGNANIMKEFKIKLTTNYLTCSKEMLSIKYRDVFGNTTTVPIRCYGSYTKRLTIYANDIIISFKRKKTDSRGYFSFEYNATNKMCGGKFTSLSAVLSSKELVSSFCVWSIKVPVTKSITLNIMNIKDGCLVGNDRLRPRLSICTAGTSINTNTSTLFLWFYRKRGIHSSITFNYTSELPAPCGYEIKATDTNTKGSLQITNQYYCRINILNYVSGRGTIRFSVKKTQRDFCKKVKFQIKSKINSKAVQSYRRKDCITEVPFVAAVNSVNTAFYSRRGNLSFTLNYKFHACGGFLDISSPVGYIKSPNYPNLYPKNTRCDWIFMANKDQYIKLTVINLHLEHHSSCKYDWLNVKFGYSDRNPIVKQYCGRHNHTNETITIHSNRARLRFKSDRSKQDIGFIILYEFIAAADNCHGVSYRLRGTIKSPNYPKPHPRKLNCNWTLVVPTSFQIKLLFDPFFDIEPSRNCQYDSLVIIDSDFSVKKRLCGHIAPNKSINSLTNRISLVFKTDYNLNLDGFKAKFWTVCGGIFNKTYGVIESPRYIYGATKCTFYIKKWKGFMTKFKIKINKYLCRYKKGGIEVWFESLRGTYLKKRNFCKEDVVTLVHAHSIKIRYNTDWYSTNKDFKITYRHESNFKSRYNVTRKIKIATPTNKYHHNANLTWIYTTLPNYTFYLNIISADIEAHSKCKYDYLLIYKSNNISSPTSLLEKICGKLHDFVLKIDSNVIRLNFISDSSHYNNHKGFKSMLIPTPGEKLGCGGDFLLNTSSTGVIQSVDLDGDGNYENNLYCIWVLSAPYGYSIELTFKDNIVKIEKSKIDRCTYDILSINDGSSRYSPEIKTLCGSVAVDPFNSTGSSLRIAFITDKTIVKKGFTINYRVVPSNSHIYRIATKTFQDIKSFNYPNSVDYNSRILIELQAPNVTDHLEIKIEELTIRNSPAHLCFPDKLTIVDTNEKFYNGFRQYCNSTFYNISYISSGQSVSIRFDTGPEMGQSGPRRYRIKYRIFNCNREETGYSGLIRNIDNYRFKYYSHNTNCLLKLTTPKPGLYFQFYFISFHVEYHKKCSFDYLQFTQQNNASNYTLPKLCGESIPASIMMNSSSAYIRFKTDASAKKPGYEFIYVVSTDPNNLYCGGNISTSIGALTSLGYGTNKFKPGNCLWRIQLPKNTQLKFTMEELEMPTISNSAKSNRPTGYCSSTTNYIRISANSRSFKYCTQKAPISAKLYVKTDIIVEYRSDTGGTGIGFRLTWKSI